MAARAAAAMAVAAGPATGLAGSYAIIVSNRIRCKGITRYERTGRALCARQPVWRAPAPTAVRLHDFKGTCLCHERSNWQFNQKPPRPCAPDKVVSRSNGGLQQV